eukprot:630862-Prorocentrum_minimum.AAC.1
MENTASGSCYLGSALGLVANYTRNLSVVLFSKTRNGHNVTRLRRMRQLLVRVHRVLSLRVVQSEYRCSLVNRQPNPLSDLPEELRRCT